MDDITVCLKKIIGEIVKRRPDLGEKINSSYVDFSPVDFYDSIIVLLTMFFNTGFVLDDKLSRINWELDRISFNGSATINHKEIYLPPDMIDPVYCNQDEIYAEIEDDILNSFLQVVRNGGAHNAFSYDFTMEYMIFLIENNKKNDEDKTDQYAFGYDSLYYLLTLLVNKIISTAYEKLITLTSNEAKNNYRQKIYEIYHMFDILYVSYRNTSNDYLKSSEVEDYIEEIDEIFKNNGIYNPPQSNIGYYTVLFSIIFGMIDWTNIDTSLLDFSAIEIDPSFKADREQKYKNTLNNYIRKIRNFESTLKETQENIFLPKVIKNDRIQKLNEYIMKYHQLITEATETYNKTFDNKTIIRHLRNTFCHGFFYYTMDGKIFIKDYDSKNNTTFKGSVSIDDLLNIILSNNLLDKIINSPQTLIKKREMI